jgi:3-isopropylmalate/(R)-2-methylmalate dehydratase small subunit
MSTGELYPCEATERLVEEFETGEEVEVDMESNTVIRLRDGKQFGIQALGDAAQVIDAGGLFEYARRTGMIAAAT